MKIQVTQTDIDNGIARSPNFCPIAQSIRRQEKTAFAVSVCSKVADYRRMNGILVDFKLPEIARNFINVFDAGYNVDPFEFEVEENVTKGYSW